MTPVAVLAQPFTLPNGVVVKNRLLKSAMSEALGTRDGAPTPELTRLYGAWAEGGIGLCVTGNVMIDLRALGEPGNVVIEDARHLEALKAWALAATAHGTHCWVQLNHPGKQSPKGLNKENVAPSKVPFRDDMKAFFATPRELLDAEVSALVKRFGQAAGVVKQAGFTGVQIHGAHGYLVSQFLSPHHNVRTDRWGGTPVKRRRFVLEVYRAMRKAVGPDFPIGIKLNSADFQRGGFTEEESLDTIRALADAGIDLIEISGGTYEAPAMTGVKAGKEPVKDSTRQREAYFLEFAEKARLAVKTPLVVTGGFRSASGHGAGHYLGRGGHGGPGTRAGHGARFAQAAASGQKTFAPGQTHHHRHQDDRQDGHPGNQLVHRPAQAHWPGPANPAQRAGPVGVRQASLGHGQGRQEETRADQVAGQLIWQTCVGRGN